MMAITTATIQALRIKTDAGMMDCKRALEEAGGDMDAAVKILREKGIAKAAKRVDRVANEGLVKIVVAGNSASMLELTSETDFVSRSEKFNVLAQEAISFLVKEQSADRDAFILAKNSQGKTIQDSIDELAAILGEKLELGRVVTLHAKATDAIGHYLHSNNKIGVLLVVENGAGQDDLVKDICMHIAAANPSVIGIADVSSADVAKEKEILRQQVINEGKPEAIADKIVEGKIRKYYEEVCLLEQTFVKDPEKKIKDVVDAAAKASGKALKIATFVRFNIG